MGTTGKAGAVPFLLSPYPAAGVRSADSQGESTAQTAGVSLPGDVKDGMTRCSSQGSRFEVQALVRHPVAATEQGCC